LPIRPRRRPVLVLLPALLVAGTLPGCAGRSGSAADREVEAILSEKRGEVRRRLDEAFVSPRAPGPEDADEAIHPEGVDREPPVDIPEVIGLRDALRIATLSNRDYVSRTEGLYLSALSLTGTRFQFGPQLASTLSYLATDATGRKRLYDQGVDLTASRRHRLRPGSQPRR